MAVTGKAVIGRFGRPIDHGKFGFSDGPWSRPQDAIYISLDIDKPFKFRHKCSEIECTEALAHPFRPHL
ncbi:MAG: hypothetical protein J0I56_00805 [Novosphingobium sp.]|uniref:hypothetical protein n=1 Tax=uncultured Novosphingobium sp. TaxID=292277 RepID=UPI001AD4819E|nr:hypothetical protein [uncultured Novosphingobium sp.]MBN9142421.1 hypothetical protein [Novosphingobium sp.]